MTQSHHANEYGVLMCAFVCLITGTHVKQIRQQDEQNKTEFQANSIFTRIGRKSIMVLKSAYLWYK